MSSHTKTISLKMKNSYFMSLHAIQKIKDLAKFSFSFWIMNWRMKENWTKNRMEKRVHTQKSIQWINSTLHWHRTLLQLRMLFILWTQLVSDILGFVEIQTLKIYKGDNLFGRETTLYQCTVYSTQSCYVVCEKTKTNETWCKLKTFDRHSEIFQLLSNFH